MEGAWGRFRIARVVCAARCLRAGELADAIGLSILRQIVFRTHAFTFIFYLVRLKNRPKA